MPVACGWRSSNCCRCPGSMTTIRSAWSMSSGVTRRAWCFSRESEFSRATRRAWKDAGLPGKAVSPTEPTSIRRREFLFSNFLRNPSAKGLRQVLPVQTKRILRILARGMEPLEALFSDMVLFSFIQRDSINKSAKASVSTPLSDSEPFLLPWRSMPPAGWSHILWLATARD